MLLGRRVSFPSASSVHRRVHHENDINSVYTAAVRRAQSPPCSPSAPSPTPESRWKRGRPVVSPRRTGDSTHSGSRLWVQNLPIRFAHKDPVALPARQGNEQQSPPRQQTVPFPDGEFGISTNASEHCTTSACTRSLRFTPTANRLAPHPTTITTESEVAHQLHVDSGRLSTEMSQNMPRAHADSEGGLGTKQDDVEIQETGFEQDSDAQYDEEDHAEQHVPLAFQIPDDALRAAMLASPNTRASYWSAKLYRGPGDKQISTHYCQSLQVAERVAKYFLHQKVVGFDIEWKPRANPASIKKNASLIQLACEDRIALFHISLFPGTSAKQLMPPTLKAILESPDIYKVGVAIKGDFSRLNKFLDIQGQGVFELSRLHNDVELHATEPEKTVNKLVGLAAQVLQHLQLPLYKGGQVDDNLTGDTNVRESDWSRPLDVQQIHYAAADAYAGFRLYHMLDWKRKQLRPVPPRRGLCDYDSKAAPKSPLKKLKTARNSKDERDVAVEQTAQAAEQEQEQVDEAEDYNSSVSEEPVDRSDPDGPIPASVSAIPGVTDDVASPSVSHSRQTTRFKVRRCQTDTMRQQTGRVNLSWLRNPDPGYPALPDPGYPILPKRTESGSTRSSQGRYLDEYFEILSRNRNSQFKEDLDVEEDEFADQELEDALKSMDINDQGKLTSDTKEMDIASELADGSQTASPSKEGQLTSCIHDEEARHTEKHAVEPSELNSVSDDPEETATVSTPTLKTPTDEMGDVAHTTEYEYATQWAQNYLQSTVPSPESKSPSRIRATLTHLRAYHIWHHQKLTMDEVAKHLRDPPLSHITTTGYILQAITLENLDYEKMAVRDVLVGMPEGLRRGRWKWLSEKVGALS
ncbi:hypothetical protein P153DRAFT_372546 [Dothidotthia symphoricarpi CBS 119687]|uniref:3'-5' exonuclease domain-containing protein n=1 Tax=Dothidotthia symphoricarpi CBS 119687 TaxID=1392245 RepID=A0A6A6AS51_9PLEO|nr:uncharacterized protein P153DRAFT_372546 [Dothidotthia symphoricarpi CBS 119687]KAF2134043.1 hypothetical protein P153DRAFT_372546 [Dothidotthia symphoricarpi CBS 119687]